MKKLAFLIAAALVCSTAMAEQPLCPTTEGAVLTYVTKDGKGKVSAYAQQTVTSVEGAESDMTVTYSSQVLDKKKKAVENVPVISYQLKVENGDLIIDLKSMLGGLMSSPTDGNAEGTPLVFPSNLAAGDKIADANVKMKIVFMSVSATYTNGICEGREDITTAAGTFNCVKIKQNCKSSAIGIKGDYVITSWYAPGIGLVKQEMWTAKGKLQQTQELDSIE
jgi:hypothetical protein